MAIEADTALGLPCLKKAAAAGGVLAAIAASSCSIRDHVARLFGQQVRHQSSIYCCPSSSVFGKNPSPIGPIGQEHRDPPLVSSILVAELFYHLSLFLSSQERVCRDDYGNGRQ